MRIVSSIRDTAIAIQEEVTGFRHYLHQFPEPSFSEVKTGEFIASVLERMKVDYRMGYAGTGIVARITGKRPGNKCIALRTDMDALPIHENTGLAYSSRNHGWMHACGHDMHMASMLGTIMILQKMREDFGGTVLCLFQPGEEKVPGGAKIMIEEGALSDPVPLFILAQHVAPDLEAGRLGFCPGKYMASSDEIYIAVRGRGGHAARPDETTDNVYAAARIVVTLKEWVQRTASGKTPAVLAFGKISGAGATNVIPSEVTLEGTFRTMDETFRQDAYTEITRLAEREAGVTGAGATVEIRKGYPVLTNDEALTARVKSLAELYIGQENVVAIPPRMTSEDFAYFSQQKPACFYRLGTGFRGITPVSLHTPSFLVNDEALVTGCGSMAWFAMSLLENG